MAYTMQQCMDDARSILRDTDAANYRVSDADLLRYGNFARMEIALRRPDLFSYFGEIPLTAGETYQNLPAGALRLMEIIRVKNGRSVKECTQDDLDQYDVNWHSATAGTTANWVRHPRDPAAFYVSPKAGSGAILIGQWSKTPDILAAADPIALSDAYAPVISDYMVFRSECRDDEYVNSGRAALFLSAFTSSLGVSSRTKATADSDQGNRDLQMAEAAQRASAARAAASQASPTAGGEL